MLDSLYSHEKYQFRYMGDKEVDETQSEKHKGGKMMSEDSIKESFMFDYYEVSAKTGENVQACINLMVEELVEQK